MYLTAEQTQYPVGQGGLHLARLWVIDEPYRPWQWRSRLKNTCASVVYDCGGYGNKGALTRNISALRSALPVRGGNKIIDLMVLSHLHHDHINGFKILTDWPNLIIRRLVIPHYDDVDKLVLMAQTAATTGTMEQVEAVSDVLADPDGWFGARGVEQVLQMRPGDEDSTPPPPEGDVDPEGYERLRGPEGRGPEGEVPEIEVRGRQIEPSGAGSHGVIVASGTFARVLPPSAAAGKSTDWILLPYCQRSSPVGTGHRNRTSFKNDVETALRGHRSPDGAIRVTSAEGKALIQSLKRAFESYVGKGSKEWNELSVSLYSGGTRASRLLVSSLLGVAVYFVDIDCFREIDRYWRGPRPLSMIIDRDCRSHAWLHTGDSNLSGGTSSWRTFYSSYLNKVSVFQLPHHGSRHNFDGSVALRPDTIAFATSKSWDGKHPGEGVVSLLHKNHVEVLDVTERQESLLRTIMIAEV